MSGERDLTAALDALMQQRGDTNVVPAPKARGAQSKQTSSGRQTSASDSGSGGDLEEKDYTARTYYDSAYKTTDGLFTFVAVKTVVLTNKSGDTQTIKFAEPTSTTTSSSS